ncbi:MAG TPA: hypothetical protein P5526_00565 [Anaerolineae bacterium]|nr:hypothetical protein [Anaerolineae bacterium]HRV90635.1 hypothetical protein [Anaerolineae bacterium]
MKNNKNRQYKLWWIYAGGLMLLSLACSLGGAATALPPGPPASFDVQVATPTPHLRQNSGGQAAAEAVPVEITPLGDAPTHTPDPNASPTPIRLPTHTPTLPPTPTTDTETLAAVGVELTSEPEPTVEPELTSEPEAVEVAAGSEPTLPPEALDPPLERGDWDFEGEYVPWPNPHGEPCPGARVAGGWNAFVENGPFGSSCLNENLYQPNVYSGAASQEITFDFIAANSGVYRTISTTPGHRYTIVAYAKHDRSAAPVEMFLGVDYGGGTAWDAETVEWFPWDEGAEDTWTATEETVTATGERLTIFIRGFHPMADQGGKTVIDNVSVLHLGP